MSYIEVKKWPREPKPKTQRRYRVRYDLAYDGGGDQWEDFYRTRLGARFAIFWNRQFASWGGSAVLYKFHDPLELS